MMGTSRQKRSFLTLLGFLAVLCSIHVLSRTLLRFGRGCSNSLSARESHKIHSADLGYEQGKNLRHVFISF